MGRAKKSAESIVYPIMETVATMEKKQAEIEAAWAQHNGDAGTQFIGPEEPVSQPAVIFGSRREINLCYNRCMPESKRLRLTEEGDVIIFANRDEINECWKRVTQRQKEAKVQRLEQRGKAKAMTELSDGAYHNLGALQMLVKPERKAA